MTKSSHKKRTSQSPFVSHSLQPCTLFSEVVEVTGVVRIVLLEFLIHLACFSVLWRDPRVALLSSYQFGNRRPGTFLGLTVQPRPFAL